MKGLLTYINYELGEGNIPLLNIFMRTETGKRRHIKVDGFHPHFFFKNKANLADFLNKQNIHFISLERAEEKSLFGDSLLDFTYINPKDTIQYRDLFYDNLEADIRFVWRYLIDKNIFEGLDIEDSSLTSSEVSISPLILYLDIEVLQEKISITGDDPIPVISVINSYTGECKTWDLRKFKTENKMLFDFQRFVRELDPDVMVGWNASGYDFPVLINRCKKLGVRDLLDWGYFGKVFFRTRELFDLDRGYRRLHLGEVRSYSLGYVAQKELGKTKTEVGNDAIKIWETNPDELVRINREHVSLVQELDEACGIIEDFFWDLKGFAGFRLLDTEFNSRIVDMLLLRKAKQLGIVLPTKKKIPDFEYEGAYCFADVGLYNDVCVFDFESMYPSIIKQFNISPETKMFVDGEVGFLQNKQGLVPLIFDDLIAKRRQIQEEMKTKSGKERERLFRKQEVLKFIINSIYGAFGYPNSRLADEDCAAAVTRYGRELLRFLKEELEKRGHKVIAGDTDSIFVTNISDVQAILALVNDELMPAWLGQYAVEAEPQMKLTFKKKFKRLVLKAKKNYAGIREDGKLEVKGLGLVKSDTSELVSEIQEQVLRDILAGEVFILQKLTKRLKEIREEPLDWFKVARGTKLTKSIEEYKSNAPHVRAVKWSNSHLNTVFSAGDKILWAFIQHPDTDVIAFDYGIDIPSEYYPNREKIIDEVRLKTDPLLQMVHLSFPEIRVKKSKLKKSIELAPREEDVDDAESLGMKQLTEFF